MDYIKSFTEQDLCKLILETKESLYICLPLLQPEVMNAIDQLNYEQCNAVSINIGLDFSPETFRQGYGEIKSFEFIERTGYNVLNFKDNRVSFVISDNIGYFLFFESRYFIPANKSTLNAVSIDPISIIRLKQHFFDLYKSEAEYKNEIANSFVDETVKLNNIHQEYSNKPVIEKSSIDNETFQKVSNDLEKNPPLKPDYKRIVDYYSNKLQYVRLEFNGANLKTKKIELPANALPLNDEEFKKRLESKLNLFDKEKSNEAFKYFNEFNIKVQELRGEFLTALKTRKENVLLKFNKVDFITKLELLKTELNIVKLKSLDKISEQIKETKHGLLKQLSDFYIQNMGAVASSDLFANSSPEYKLSRAKELSEDIIYQIKWPIPHLILSDFKFNVQFSDITFEDLQNKDLIKELIEKKLISGDDISNLADFGKAIDVK